MLLRFSLYGFLKNQRYFEPFLVLVFLEKGLGFFSIGLLIAFREITVNALEIPSGALADTYSRRLSLVLSFSAYIASFLVFARAERLAWLALAMLFYAVGDAFRSGTHKAMIFEWLRLEGRLDERTRVYGYTRSWSKLGSAVSVVLAALLVFLADSYTYIFYFSVIPYALGIVNFLGYPSALDGDSERRRTAGEAVAGLREALSASVHRPGLRRLVLESMGFEGVFHVVKDYLQPVLQAMVVGTGASILATQLGVVDLSQTQRTAFLIGPVYFVLYLLSAAASRQAHRVASAASSEDAAARWLWALAAAVYAAILVGGWAGIYAVLVLAFVVLHTVQNIWRPILISRFDQHGEAARGATILSVESQARRISTAVLAPVLGLLVDQMGGAFWPLGAVGLAVAAGFLVVGFLVAKPRQVQ